MTADPRLGFWLGIITGILVFSSTGQGAAELISVLGNATGNAVVGVCGYIAGILALVTGALHAIPSSNGPNDAKAFYLGPKS